MDLIIKRISLSSATVEDYELKEYVEKYGLYVSMQQVACGGLVASFSIDNSKASSNNKIEKLLKAALIAYKQKNKTRLNKPSEPS